MTPKIIALMLENTYTVNDLLHRTALLRAFLEAKLFGGTGGAEVSLDSVLAREEADEASAVAVRRWYDELLRQKISLESLRKALPDVEEDMRGLPVLRLYGPVTFEPAQVERIGRWVREKLDPNLMLELMVDARAAGGCAFVWHDSFHDYSLRHFIHVHREKLVAVFDRYGSVEHK